jgi:flagellar biosynthetic protein FliQ
MDFGEGLDLTREALMMVLTVASPILLIGVCVGLTISLLQSVTQLQEQTLTFVPKIAAMAVSASFFGPWIAKRLLEYAETLLGQPPF